MIDRLRYRLRLLLAIATLSIAGPARAEYALQQLPQVMPAQIMPPGPIGPVIPLSQQYAAGDFYGAPLPGPMDCGMPWSWELLPEEQIYPSYLAGVKEPRFAGLHLVDEHGNWIQEGVLGAKVGILRYGSPSGTRPEGWQWDVEGAAFPRLDLENEFDLVATDFRIGTDLVYGIGPWQTKFAYYHLSSHVGDEFLIKNPGFVRINYKRDAFVFGQSYYCNDDLRLYGEVGYAFATDGGAKPWEFQFGIDYSPAGPTGFRGAPFAAINGYLREEVDFGGGLVMQGGWQWRARPFGSLLRIGLQYYNGPSPQFEFFSQHEETFGLGIWYDF